ncbi:cysteine proteinase RD21a-like [Hibiscus syriacus]|uniref:Cysteine proteinase RD21a-like n=1 Tax=Hibiscus syriacus TaxID=106335 RepID=A0A6A3CC25_HIBSY|nr:phosphatidylinositol 3,4,5-trisphosphate 3-phosphatase and protein-tyrosine-phosphatase PTEN2A-like [Hibiscus syriacus]XP_039057990.1 phosphatidylinositol 3,4,5-trisphosphate 3-phosphatase and protein-tyrosine-phosphatase PTEN2A-like [Hibiscus syriacus]KAE8726217.1 cysteine proteinase RD21a-like [Hibiscus syriacus]
MDNVHADLPSSPPAKASDAQTPAGTDSRSTNSNQDAPSKLSSWAKNLKVPQPFATSQENSPTGNAGKSTFSRFTSGLGLRLSPKSPPANDGFDGESTTTQPGLLGTITKGIVDSSKNAVKAVQVKARHVVSQNKRRFQEGGFDLDMTYITENIIAMGFPAGDMSSGFFGYVEGFYRNHMEEVIKFFETYHKDKYKVYNLCSERLYDASLLEGKVASFPFDDHNCPPIQLIISFCQSAYSWLKEDIENVVVVHCKAGMARTGLMISSLLLYLKFFPTAEESIDYYNQKRCVDGKGLVLPSQIRYVKYFERTLTYFNGENQPGRRCMLRGFRLHRCPYWIRPSITISDHNGILFSTKKHQRTKDLSPEDFWFSAPKKGVMVFALPGEPGLTELAGDFKIHFHDRQGDFYCWLNTTMIENRKVLNTGELDWFDKRKLPSPGFQVEVVLVDCNGSVPTMTDTTPSKPDESSGTGAASIDSSAAPANENKDPGHNDKDDVFSDGEAEQSDSSKSGQNKAASAEGIAAPSATSKSETNTKSDQVASLVHSTKQVSLGSGNSQPMHATGEPSKAAAAAGGTQVSSSESEFRAMAADASVFSFGDDEDYESE